jgi:hypothetical protein
VPHDRGVGEEVESRRSGTAEARRRCRSSASGSRRPAGARPRRPGRPCPCRRSADLRGAAVMPCANALSRTVTVITAKISSRLGRAGRTTQEADRRGPQAESDDRDGDRQHADHREAQHRIR